MYAFWPKKAILKCMQILFMRIYLYHIIILHRIYKLCELYLCDLVLLTYSHKYSACINNQLYGISWYLWTQVELTSYISWYLWTQVELTSYTVSLGIYGLKLN